MIIKDLVKELTQGKNIERNLPTYMNELMTLHNNGANYAMAFHYYTFVEMLMENDFSDIDGFQNDCDIVKECIDVCYQEKSTVEQGNECITKLDQVRNRVISKMKILTAYTDAFQIYEYILNRLEAKYNNLNYTVNDEVFAKEIMQYIFADKDNAASNAKIQEIVGQLPVRMTKARFLDLVKDSLSIYQGSDKSSVEMFLYMVRTGATLERPEGMDTEYESIRKYKETFEKTDYKNLTVEQYVDLRLLLEEAVQVLERNAQAYYTIQEVINDLYTVLLTKPYANMPGTIETFKQDMPTCSKLMKELNSIHVSQTKEMPNHLVAMVNELVGKQERLVDLRNVAESVFYDVELNYKAMLESMMLSTAAGCIERANKLQSGSIFVELDKDITQEVADEIYMKRTEKELLQELNDLLASSTQVLSRAIMGNVLSKLPVFFNNQNEVSDYIYSSLSGCKDTAEKSACIQLIKEIIG